MFSDHRRTIGIVDRRIAYGRKFALISFGANVCALDTFQTAIVQAKVSESIVIVSTLEWTPTVCLFVDFTYMYPNVLSKIISQN